MRWISGNRKKIVITLKDPVNNGSIDINKNITDGKNKNIIAKISNKSDKSDKSDENKNVHVAIPYKKLEMIRILQEKYPYEVKGTFYFDTERKFRSFEIRTDLDPVSATGSEEWALFFHTHPRKTAETLGLRFFSPPSTEDVMEIYERTLRDQGIIGHYHNNRKTSKCKRMGETSIIIASEGVWILQVDKTGFLKMVERVFRGSMPDEEILEVILNETFSGFINETLNLKKDKNKQRLLNGQRASDETLEELARKISNQYGFRLRFISWKKIQEKGDLTINTQLEHLKELLEY